ncbi:MAG: PKD domain-containing protein [Microthrixaceae bacterium]|nr:PKD domain-containing protein [Microthrixaceae bacterium]
MTFTARLAGGAPVNVRAMRRANLDAAFLGGTGNLKPRARITWVSQGGVRPNYTVVLDSANSSDADGSITSRTWAVTPPADAPPGSVVQTPGPSPTQVTLTFSGIGTYQVILTVGDGMDTATDRRNVTVDNQAPVATLAVVGDSDGRVQGGGSPPRTFVFDAGGSHDPDDGGGVTYSWDFRSRSRHGRRRHLRFDRRGAVPTRAGVGSAR